MLAMLDSELFERGIFDQTGLFIVRRVIPTEVMDAWQLAWANFETSVLALGRKVNKFNPVAIEEKLPTDLLAISRYPLLLDIVEQAFGPDVALYNQRFVVKDRYSREPVFLHHDCPYHFGFATKASAFVPLSEMTPENGGMVFYPGTHQFGYLGDAGEINADILDAAWPEVAPRLTPGDVALMHSSTWHRSGPHVSGPDRILADVIYQPANDPSGIALLRGEWRTEIFLPSRANDLLFRRSRTSMLKGQQMKIDQLATIVPGWQSRV